MRSTFILRYSALAGAVLGLFAIIHTSHAGEATLRALTARDLAPAAEIYAKETLFLWTPGGETALGGDGLILRLPIGGKAEQVLVGGPVNSVIADIALEKGPLAMTPRTAKALGLQADNAQLIQIVALKRLPRATGVPLPGFADQPALKTESGAPAIVQ